MTKEERDKLIIEELGGCWHEWKGLGHTFPGAWSKCPKCYKHPIYMYPNLSLSTPNGFFWVWDRLWKMKWSGEFLIYLQENANLWKYDPQAFPVYFINPDRFADALAEFLTQRKEKP